MKMVHSAELRGWDRGILAGIAVALLLAAAAMPDAARGGQSPDAQIVTVEPPEKGFFSKRLGYAGIPIKAHKDVSDEALLQGRARLAMMLDKLPEVRRRLQAAGAELHIIGRNQVTSDLPEFRHMKGKPFDGKQTIDERTRGMGGLLTSCGEENLLKLEKDRYRGRDICVHEFAHNIQGFGMSEAVRVKFRAQYHRSLTRGLWKGSYAGSNEHEFFAELSMWYWGTHGDLGMTGRKPANGRDGLNAYDPEACALLDHFYSGKLDTPAEAEAATIDREKRPDHATRSPTRAVRNVAPLAAQPLRFFDLKAAVHSPQRHAPDPHRRPDGTGADFPPRAMGRTIHGSWNVMHLPARGYWPS